MNIAEELGSLISGLLAPQASSSVQKPDKGLSSRSRTRTSDQGDNRQATKTTRGSDRLTLSGESLALCNKPQEQAASSTVTSTANRIQSSYLPALPCSPSTTSEPRQKTDEESPATRQLVRTTYGINKFSSTAETSTITTHLDFHA